MKINKLKSTALVSIAIAALFGVSCGYAYCYRCNWLGGPENQIPPGYCHASTEYNSGNPCFSSTSSSCTFYVSSPALSIADCDSTIFTYADEV